MNINESIQELHNVTGLPVSPDLYEGGEESYITYTYIDEHVALYGDDAPDYDELSIRVDLYTPPTMNYMNLKHQIRDYLETLGGVSSIGSWIDTYVSKGNLETKKRHTSFEVYISQRRE